MTTATATIDSATERPLGLRQRADLFIEPHPYGNRQYWLVKDPVAARYFHLADEEHALLAMLDGHISLGQLKRRFEAAFGPLEIGFEQLYSFLGRLHSLGLLVADRFGQGEQLLRRLAENRQRSRLAALGNILAIRIPGIDPGPLLGWLYPKCRWMFSPRFLAMCVGLVLAAFALALFQFRIVQAGLPNFREFITPQNMVWLFVALAISKIVHELAHALTCVHVGGQCHEIGLLLLVFTPCLYCDVSDAWSIGNKWRRIAVSAAGIIVESCLAATATFLWWFTAPGVFHTLCLNVMIVCSVSTLLLNGNPLLRYDGYYVLSDWLEVPNLGQQSQALLNRLLARSFLGIELPADRGLPERSQGLLVAYAVASILYRWALVLGILWFCDRAARSYGLEPIAFVLAVVVIAGMVIAPARHFARFLGRPSIRRDIVWPRTWLLSGALLAAPIVLFTLPLPCHVAAPAVFQPRDARMVYVAVPGRLVDAAAAGESVHKGDVLARLENLDVDREIAELTLQRNQQRLQLQNSRLRMIDDPKLAGEVKGSESALEDLEGRLRQRKQDRESLLLRAPCDGIVLPPPRVDDASGNRDRLHAWQGSPLDKRNAGCVLKKGSLVCMVGPPDAREVLAVVEQSDVNLVEQGQNVRLQVDEAPGQILTGTIAEVGNLDVKVLPRELAKGGDLPVHPDEKGIPRPLGTLYEVRVVLDESPDAHLLPGARGRANISVAPQSPALRSYRYLLQLFSAR